jgi:hypothetical protein
VHRVLRPWKTETSSFLRHRRRSCSSRARPPARPPGRPPARISNHHLLLRILSVCCCLSCVRHHLSVSRNSRLDCTAAVQIWGNTHIPPTLGLCREFFTDSSRQPDCTTLYCRVACPPACPPARLPSRPPACQQAPFRSIESQGPSTQEHTHARTHVYRLHLTSRRLSSCCCKRHLSPPTADDVRGKIPAKQQVREFAIILHCFHL